MTTLHVNRKNGLLAGKVRFFFMRPTEANNYVRCPPASLSYPFDFFTGQSRGKGGKRGRIYFCLLRTLALAPQKVACPLFRPLFLFNAVGMVGRFREQVTDDSFREGAASLILFPDHSHTHAGRDVGSVVAVHGSVLYHRSPSKPSFFILRAVATIPDDGYANGHDQRLAQRSRASICQKDVGSIQ